MMILILLILVVAVAMTAKKKKDAQEAALYWAHVNEFEAQRKEQILAIAIKTEQAKISHPQMNHSFPKAS